MPYGFYPRTEEHKNKLREQLRGYIGSSEKNPFFGKHHTKEYKKISSDRKKGKRVSIGSEFKKGIVPWNKGKKLFHLRGENSPSWKGGLNTARRNLRKSPEYKDWHHAVLKRDNWTCQACGLRGGKLEVDHELPFAFYPDLRFEVLNGRTFCKPCHLKTGTWGRKARMDTIGVQPDTQISTFL